MDGIVKLFWSALEEDIYVPPRTSLKVDNAYLGYGLQTVLCTMARMCMVIMLLTRCFPPVPFAITRLSAPLGLV